MDHWDLYSAVKFPGIGDTDMKTPVFSGITLFGDNIELMKSYMKPRRCWVIVVAGYDTSLPADEIKKALTDHFRSCGAIAKVEMPRHPVESSVIIVGDDANEKALELNGSEMGGRKLVVTARPFPMLKRKDVPFA
ncbi:RNA-binding domain superfamily [Arabidopsis suecica]|uniref:RNA-binding domain superfamily n=1 Tax=Arabidopsis suecica TaxID=45249 RepID=A0A8T1YK01_ARASU|nr:RNA-binding domain superfamily [Arabidopsis suecica]